jgi:hypothetical protein
LLLLMVMSGLAIALTASGRIEVAMGDNEELYAGARAAAESGLNHAAAVILSQVNNPVFVLNDILRGPDNATNPSNPSASVNDDNGVISHLLTGTAPWLVAPGSAYSYDVRLFDDDDPILKGGAFTNVELTAMGPPPDPAEDGSRLVDVNKRIVIRATGFGPRGTTATLEQMLNPIKMPALLVDGNLTVQGNATISGTQGSVHANQNLSIPDRTVSIAQNATAAGTLTAHARFELENPDGVESGGMAIIPVFDIVARDYIGEADFVLQSDGRITNRNETATYCNAGQNCSGITPSGFSPAYTLSFGWVFQSGRWTLSQRDVLSATFFSETDVVVNGNTGSGPPTNITLIAEGDITIMGTPNLGPEPDSNLMFVTDKDLVISGNLVAGELLRAEGRVLVREQIHFIGTGTLSGQVIVQDETDTLDSEYHSGNVVEGNFEIGYNGLVETVAYSVSGWRETP